MTILNTYYHRGIQIDETLMVEGQVRFFYDLEHHMYRTRTLAEAAESIDRVLDIDHEAQMKAQEDQWKELEEPSRSVEIKVYGNFEGSSWYAQLRISSSRHQNWIRNTAHYESESSAYAAALKLARLEFQPRESPLKASK